MSAVGRAQWIDWYKIHTALKHVERDRAPHLSVVIHRPRVAEGALAQRVVVDVRAQHGPGHAVLWGAGERVSSHEDHMPKRS